MGFKHLVILGAGSTIATIPKGDKNGEFSYTLDNLLNDKCFASFVEKVQALDYQIDDVEALCNQLYKENRPLYDEFESLVRKKYASLELPDGFTILDRLVLSLTPNDAIISFNWDDLVIQAYQRMSEYVPEEMLPILAFLHRKVTFLHRQVGIRYGNMRSHTREECLINTTKVLLRCQGTKRRRCHISNKCYLCKKQETCQNILISLLVQVM